MAWQGPKQKAMCRCQADQSCRYVAVCALLSVDNKRLWLALSGCTMALLSLQDVSMIMRISSLSLYT